MCGGEGGWGVRANVYLNVCARIWLCMRSRVCFSGKGECVGVCVGGGGVGVCVGGGAFVFIPQSGPG